MPGSGSNCAYCAPSTSARALKAAASAGVHQSRRTPSASVVRPWSSNWCVISWPMTAPAAP
jgi:hypothetical protein